MITQTEIICLAIQALDAKIEKWRKKCADCGDARNQQLLEMMTSDEQMKREMLYRLYEIQTGKKYN